MKKVMLSGIKPSGQLTLGNYIGALIPFVENQDEYDLKVFIANLHCITMPIDSKELETNLRDALAFYLAVGLDPQRATIFLQSDIPEIAQLGFILATQIYMGELNRQTQYKDKKETEDSLSAGFYTYPTLMAADILAHDADFVPVGEDQKQHVELTRDVATRFNNRFSETFKVPEPIIPKVGARIMSLSDPSKKMSKSDTEGDKGVIYLKEDLKKTRKKIMSAVTDSVNKVQYDPENQPGVSNLLTIYAVLKNVSVKDAEAHFKDHQYGGFKKEVADVVCERIEAIQGRYHEIIDSSLMDDVLQKGSDALRQQVQSKLQEVQFKMGLDWKRR